MLASTSATNTQGIGFFVTENGSGTAAINQFTFNEPTTGLNGTTPVTITTSSTPIESGLIGADLVYFTSFENDSSGLFTGTGNGAAYSVAWGQYNSSTDTYTVNYQIFSTLGATTDASNPDLASDSSGANSQCQRCYKLHGGACVVLPQCRLDRHKWHQHCDLWLGDRGRQRHDEHVYPVPDL